jgi:hypothetical protein
MSEKKEEKSFEVISNLISTLEEYGKKGIEVPGIGTFLERKTLLSLIDELSSKMGVSPALETDSMKALRLLLGVAILLDLKDVQAKILNTMVDLIREKK